MPKGKENESAYWNKMPRSREITVNIAAEYRQVDL
jgi:hypothetical protein